MGGKGGVNGLELLVFVGEGSGCGLLELSLVLLHLLLVQLHFSGGKGGRLDEFQVGSVNINIIKTSSNLK